MCQGGQRILFYHRLSLVGCSGGDGILQWLGDGAVASLGGGMLGRTKATALGKSLRCQGVLCFVPEDAEFEEYQNEGLQKGAALARGILYELSLCRAMEKIMCRPQKDKREDSSCEG